MTAVHLQVPVGGRPGSDVGSVVELARRAEDAGFDGIVVVDHSVMGERPEQYPFGTFGFTPDSAWIDPLVTLAAVAAVTSEIELMTSVLVAPVRSPGVLAKQVATLAQLAGDRVRLGVGVGWQREEYTAARLDFADRGRLLDDTMLSCRALWSGTPATVNLPTIQLERIWCEPRPISGPPPILLGGQLNARNVQRITDWADGWMPHPMASDVTVREGIATLRSALQRADRDPDRLLVHIFRTASPAGPADLEAVLGQLDEYAVMGVTSVAIPLATFAGDQTTWDAAFEYAHDSLRHAAR